MVAKKTTKTKKPGTGLARPGDPLITSRGDILEPNVKPPVKGAKTFEQQIIDPSEYRPTKKRNIKELPAAPNVINGVAAVFMYTLLGVGDREIADTLKVTVEQITDLRKHSAYGECFQAIHEEFINASSDLLTSRIAAYSHTALKTVGHLVEHGKKEEVKLRASMDMLDRAGVRPKDQEQRQQMTRNDLRIIVVDGEKNTDVELNIGDM